VILLFGAWRLGSTTIPSLKVNPRYTGHLEQHAPSAQTNPHIFLRESNCVILLFGAWRLGSAAAFALGVLGLGLGVGVRVRGLGLRVRV